MAATQVGLESEAFVPIVPAPGEGAVELVSVRLSVEIKPNWPMSK